MVMRGNRNQIPQLVAQVEALTAELEALRAEVNAVKAQRPLAERAAAIMADRDPKVPT